MLNKVKIILIFAIFTSVIFISMGLKGVSAKNISMGLKGQYSFAGTVLNPNLSGYKNISLNQFKGKVVVVNFWATWCPPCRAEIPLLEKFYLAYKRYNAIIIGVNVNITKDGVKRFIDKYGVKYPVIHATPNIMSVFGNLSEIPQSFFFNRQGKLVFHWTGELPGMVLQDVVNKLLIGGKQ
ncbi:MAG: TlpA family protein disulfide reductase [bacterium]